MIDQSMIEIVAKAMAEESEFCLDAVGHENMIRLARAAIIAMRKPNHAMVDALQWGGLEDYCAAIDAALKEGPRSSDSNVGRGGLPRPF